MELEGYIESRSQVDWDGVNVIHRIPCFFRFYLFKFTPLRKRGPLFSAVEGDWWN